MIYRDLGKTGVKVSAVCLGTAFRGQEDEATCIRVIDRAIDLGCNFIDTALYGGGRAESFIGKALKGKREDIVLCTKVIGSVGSGPNHSGLSRRHLLLAAEASLKRLQTDHVDVYLLHIFDPDTPIEQTLRGLDDLVRQGKARYVGCSNFEPWRVMQGLWTSDRTNLERYSCIQNLYNLILRTETEQLMPVCREYGLGIMAYSPLAVGLLSGRFRRGQPPPPNTVWGPGELKGLSPGKSKLEQVMTERVDRIVQTVIDIGTKHDKTPGQVAVAWVLDHPEVSSALFGPDEPEHVDEICGALDWKLDPQDRALLDEVSTVDIPRTY